MPLAVFKRILEVSSEDPNYPASSLLKYSAGKKWKGKSTGLDSVFVVIQLEKASQITGIDIENEHSAFVEVLVGKAGCKDEDFKDILLTCSFMTPPESKDSSYPNRVRCFKKSSLVESIASQKWDLVKVLCSQPFNTNVQYGLSFIKFHITEEENPKERTLIKKDEPTKLFAGKFKLREDSPESESNTSMGLFNRWKSEKSNPEKASSDTSKRHQHTDASKKAESSTPKPKKVDMNLSAKRRSSEKDVGKPKPMDIDLHDKRTPSSKRQSTENEIRSVKKMKYDSDDDENRKSSKDKKKIESLPGTSKTSSDKKRSSSSKSHTKSAKVDENDNRKSITYKPFNKLLEGVTIVISGIQNPDRANIRSMALALGAKYKGDWDNSCTHLICAYKNTPKYNQVKALGKIVKRQWVEKCHNLKKHLPWRRYALDDKEAEKPESDEEILDESSKPVSEKKERTVYDEESNNIGSSGDDTEDELERARSKLKGSPGKTKSPKKKEEKTTPEPVEKDEFEVTTDEEEFTISRRGIFSGKRIFLSASLSAVDHLKLSDLLNEHKAIISEKDSSSNIIISTKNEKEFSVDYVTPQWVYESCDMKCLLPTKRYLA